MKHNNSFFLQVLVNTLGPLSVSERSPMRLNESERKSLTPPTTNSFSSSADETLGVPLSREAQVKHKRLADERRNGEQRGEGGT